MIKRIVYLSLCISCMLCSRSFAQLQDDGTVDPTIKGNTSGSSSGGGNIYDVNLYNGTANVNIPIHSYSIDGLDLGVSLSYNTSGIKVDQTASEIGLGWSLNMGGYITRKVRGIEDEAYIPWLGLNDEPVPRSKVPEQRGKWVYNYSNPANWAVNEDPECDEFTAVLGGKTINFKIQMQDGNGSESPRAYTIATDPHTNIYVDVIHDNVSYIVSGHILHFGITPGIENDIPTDANIKFKIYDEQGNQYFFERGDIEKRTHTSKITPGETADYYVTNKWDLVKIQTYTGAEILYEYDRTSNISYPAYVSQQVREAPEPYYFSYSGGTELADGGVVVEEAKNVKWDGTQTNIRKIIYPNGTIVDFTYHTNRCDILNAKAIDAISISSQYESSFKNTIKYKFNYAYFNSPQNDDPSSYQLSFATPCSSIEHNSTGELQTRLRLKLLGIDRVGRNNNTESYYSFDYNNTLLPPRLSPKQDWFGYYNGATITAPTVTPDNDDIGIILKALLTVGGTHVPLHDLTFYTMMWGFIPIPHYVSYGIDRTPNITYAKAGILTKVNNGLCGELNFSYKAHVLDNPPDFRSSDRTKYYYFEEYRNYKFPVIPPDMQVNNANDGLCIDNVIQKDCFHSTNQTTTQYEFFDGVRFYPAAYFWYVKYSDHAINQYSDYEKFSFIERMWQNNFVTPIEPVKGALHGYSLARVKVLGDNNEVISFKNYHFTNLISKNGEIFLAKEKDDNPAIIIEDPEPGNTSRIRAPYGILAHTLPMEFVYAHRMGLVMQIDDCDKYGWPKEQVFKNYLETPVDPLQTISTPDGPDYGEQQQIFNFQVPPYIGTPYVVRSRRSSVHNKNMLLRFEKTVKKIDGKELMSTLGYSYTYNKELWGFKGNPNPNLPAIFEYTYNYNSIGPKTIKYSDSKGDNYTITNDYVDFDYLLKDFQYGGSPFENTKARVHGFFLTKTVKSNNGRTVDWQESEIDDLGDGYMRLSKLKIMPVSATGGITSLYTTTHYNKFDSKNNVLETKFDNEQKITSDFWDTRIGEKVAHIVNAAYDDVAYTSFEGVFRNDIIDENKGNWVFNPSYINKSTSMTGRYSFELSTALASNVGSLNPLTNGKEYILSFWALGDAPYVTAGSYIPITQQLQIGNWKLYTAYIIGSGDFLSIGQTNSFTCKIDELRLYPANAAMETYTYEPLLGKSSYCDQRNNIEYYEYDDQGRLSITRDIDGNIRSKVKRVNQGDDN